MGWFQSVKSFFTAIGQVPELLSMPDVDDWWGPTRHGETWRLWANHGGWWTITRDACHLGGPSLWQFRASPESVPETSYVLVPEWNGWRFGVADSGATNIAIPGEVVELMFTLAKESR